MTVADKICVKGFINFIINISDFTALADTNYFAALKFFSNLTNSNNRRLFHGPLATNACALIIYSMFTSI